MGQSAGTEAPSCCRRVVVTLQVDGRVQNWGLALDFVQHFQRFLGGDVFLERCPGVQHAVSVGGP